MELARTRIQDRPIHTKRYGGTLEYLNWENEKGGKTIELSNGIILPRGS
jgi:hypothetical protein